MISSLPWWIWLGVGAVIAANLATLALGYWMGANKGDKPEAEQVDPHENPSTWGRP